MITPQRTALLIVLIWCTLETHRANLLSPGAESFRVLLVVSLSPHRMEWTVRRLHWEMGLAKGIPFEIAVLLQAESYDAEVVAGLLMRDGLVTSRFQDREPDMVVHI